jgi:hypothetical protein
MLSKTIQTIMLMTPFLMPYKKMVRFQNSNMSHFDPPTDANPNLFDVLAIQSMCAPTTTGQPYMNQASLHNTLAAL